jgi:hypothetical protein
MKQQLQCCHRSKTFIYRTITASLPFIEVDLNLTIQQMSMFINGLKYIIPCQKQFARKSIEQIVSKQYQNTSELIKRCLWDHRISTNDERAKQAFQALEHILPAFQLKKLPRKLTARAHHEHQLVQTVKRLLGQRSDIIIRRTDKSKVFYIGKTTDFVHKTQEYMLKTQAYEEITNGRCPLSNTFDAVKTLFKLLVTKNALTQKQQYLVLPKKEQLELGHYHAQPKPHKVNIFLFINNYYLHSPFLFLFITD